MKRISKHWAILAPTNGAEESSEGNGGSPRKAKTSEGLNLDLAVAFKTTGITTAIRRWAADVLNAADAKTGADTAKDAAVSTVWQGVRGIVADAVGRFERGEFVVTDDDGASYSPSKDEVLGTLDISMKQAFWGPAAQSHKAALMQAMGDEVGAKVFDSQVNTANQYRSTALALGAIVLRAGEYSRTPIKDDQAMKARNLLTLEESGGKVGYKAARDTIKEVGSSERDREVTAAVKKGGAALRYFAKRGNADQKGELLRLCNSLAAVHKEHKDLTGKDAKAARAAIHLPELAQMTPRTGTAPEVRTMIQ